MGLHFQNQNPDGFPNFWKAISGVKIHWIEKFFIPLKNF
jgi:hypothetical protein